MRIQGPTDVLSFRTMPWFLGDVVEPDDELDAAPRSRTEHLRTTQAKGEDHAAGAHALLEPPELYGDLALSWAAVERQATGRTPLAHLDEALRLLVHGLAHLEGHDHLHPADARRMHALERRGLVGAQTPDFPRPYAPAQALRVRAYLGAR